MSFLVLLTPYVKRLFALHGSGAAPAPTPLIASAVRFCPNSKTSFRKRLRLELFPPGDVQLTLLFLPLRNCRVPACKPIRLRSPLASLAPRKSVALKRATRSDLDAPISSLLSPCFASLLPRCAVKGARTPRNRRTTMKVEQAKQIASKAIEQLSEALERGHSETLRNYLAAMAKFHRQTPLRIWHLRATHA